MVGTSKILTVSYGTFSCTLEGFDDSFNTMKAIAEYFRDLAADDRYFGAEPPTPDAELLAKIAEREISRRVDARMDDDGIVLRAAALSDQSVDDPSHEDAPEHTAESRAKVDADRKAAKAARKAEKAARKAEAKAAREAEKKAERQAAKRAARQAERKAEREAEKARQKAEADSQKQADTEHQNSTSDAPTIDAADDAEGTTDSAVEETRDTALSSTLAAAEPAPEINADADEAPAHPDANSVAAKLQRIRAVVSTAAPDDATPSDDLTEQFLPQSEGPDVSDAADDQETDTAPQADPEDSQGDGSDMISRVMARHSDDNAEAPEADTAEDNTAHEETAETPRPRVVRMKRADFEKAMSERQAARASEEDAKASPTPTDTPPAGPDFAMLDGADELDEYLEDSDFTLDAADDLAVPSVADLADSTPVETAVEAEEEATEPEEEVQSALAKNLAALRAAETLKTEEAEVEAEEETSAEAEDVSDVADTDEDEIQAEVDAEAEDAEAIDEVETDDATAEESDAYVLSQDQSVESADEVDEAEADTSAEPTETAVDDASVDRLMSESDVQMQEPEGNRRRDAMAQLKAAVAAKEAARQMGEPEDDGVDVENAFRNDLSEAVKPEGETATPRPRPVVRTATTRTERPRPAPLKLVAAQRVDSDGDAPTRDGPVVPRRVAARKADPSEPRTAGSFAEFADNMGAKELPDLLEAAAAYTAFVEGADEFSRPQILRRVRAVASDDFKREDELRTFADLISTGRFTKVRNGRFQVADDSRYNPERAAS